MTHPRAKRIRERQEKGAVVAGLCCAEVAPLSKQEEVTTAGGEEQLSSRKISEHDDLGDFGLCVVMM